MGGAHPIGGTDVAEEAEPSGQRRNAVCRRHERKPTHAQASLRLNRGALGVPGTLLAGGRRSSGRNSGAHPSPRKYRKPTVVWPHAPQPTQPCTVWTRRMALQTARDGTHLPVGRRGSRAAPLSAGGPQRVARAGPGPGEGAGGRRSQASGRQTKNPAMSLRFVLLCSPIQLRKRTSCRDILKKRDKCRWKQRAHIPPAKLPTCLYSSVHSVKSTQPKNAKKKMASCAQRPGLAGKKHMG